MNRQICFGSLLLVLLAAAVYAKKQNPVSPHDEQKRALHALDRLTFGPRPGEVETVAAMGVDSWIEQQLHPRDIDDSAMQARLATYRTLQMNAREMVLEFPNAGVAIAARTGKLPMPNDPYGHAIYAAQLDWVDQRQNRKVGTAAAQNGVSANDEPDVDALHERARAAVDGLISLPPDERMHQILALPVGVQHYLLSGIGSPKRETLFAGHSAKQRETIGALGHPDSVVDVEAQSAKLLRAVYSDRQLEEVLTDFWFNHFNVFIHKDVDQYFVTSYERDVIRPHVLGKFRDLLIATAQSPAMLFYLDNWQSVGPESTAAQQRPGRGLNENYARELMELHTLGVNGGYTQHDVTEVARVFTGWTIDQPPYGAGFVFRPVVHEPGSKAVLGQLIKESGEKEGLQVLTLLARQPATARFISTELAQRFVSDDPPPSLIDAMSSTFLSSDGDLREVLRTMFHSPEFWAPEAYGARVKTPFEFMASSLRAVQAEVSDPQPLLATLHKMGEPLYAMQTPNGYSTRAEIWVNSGALLDRMNFGLAIATNKMPGTRFDLAQLINSAAKTGPPLIESGASSSHNSASGASGTMDPYQVQLKLEQIILEGGISKHTHDIIEQQMASVARAEVQGPTNQPDVSVIAGLLLGSPEFQRK